MPPKLRPVPASPKERGKRPVPPLAGDKPAMAAASPRPRSLPSTPGGCRSVSKDLFRDLTKTPLVKPADASKGAPKDIHTGPSPRPTNYEGQDGDRLQAHSRSKGTGKKRAAPIAQTTKDAQTACSQGVPALTKPLVGEDSDMLVLQMPLEGVTNEAGK